MPNLQKIERRLEERSHLTFEFPQTSNRIFRTYLPFLENPKILERSSSLLNEYNLIGRPGSLFSYGGANSRSIDITFNISLLHLIDLDTKEAVTEKFRRSFNLFFADNDRAKDMFNLQRVTPIANPSEQLDLTPGAYSVLSPEAQATNELQAFNQQQELDKLTSVGDIKRGTGFPHASTHRRFYREMVGQVIGGDPVFDNVANSLVNNYIVKGINAIPGIFGDEDAPGISSSSDAQARLDSLIDLIYVWVNLVRSSVLNNSENTVQGPPIIRLTHGPMYNNVPCIAEDYSIRIIDESGFDIQTLTPKQLEISLKLRELRTGNFTSFKEGAQTGGDTIAGWEAVIKNNNMDPYNGLIRSEEGVN